MRNFLAILLAIILAVPANAQDPARSSSARGRTLLFVDDHDVLYRSGTKRVLNPLKRHSDRAVLDCARPWEVGIGYCSVYHDPVANRYQLWYQSYAGNRAGERRLKCVVCYAESNDGIHFTRPELDLFPYKGQKSNIVLVSNAGHGDRYCCSVLVDTHEKDPARRYKMAYYDWSMKNGREEPGLHVAFSPDGIHWTKHPGTLLPTLYGGRETQPPFSEEDGYMEAQQAGKSVPRKTWSYPLTLSDVIDVFWDPVRRVFVLLGKFWLDGPAGGAAWRNGIARSESADFIHWSKPELVLYPDDDDDPEVDFHGAPGFYHKGRYFALNQCLRRRENLAIDIELLTSRDGIHWERPFRKDYFLPRSPRGLFDSRTLLSNSTPVLHDDEIRFYYGAANVAPLDGVRADPSQYSGIGMATIPLDRFAGIRAVERSAQTSLRRPLDGTGQVTLRPLDLKGCNSITVNADARGGSIRVEVLNEAGHRVRGFTKDDAAAIQGDSLRHPVRWRERKLLSDLPPGRYLLRLHLERATLFAISIQ